MGRNYSPRNWSWVHPDQVEAYIFADEDWQDEVNSMSMVLLVTIR
jgi:hypothetical protein